MRRFLSGLTVLGLLVTAAVAICGERGKSAVLETTAKQKEFIIQEGPKLISEDKYDQVLTFINDLSAAEKEAVQIKIIECFANLKCWVSEHKPFCKSRFFNLGHILVQLGNRDATSLLLVFLKGNDAWTRRYAAELLGRIGDKTALGDLKDVAERDTNEGVRYYAKWAYARISSKKFSIEDKELSATVKNTAVLKEFLIQEGPALVSEGKYDPVLNYIAKLPPQEREDVQIRTIESFANLKCWVSEGRLPCRINGLTQQHNLILLGDSAATPMILVFLNDADEWMRRYAAELLGHIGDKRALETLRDAAENDENYRVRHYAKWAYRMISEGKQNVVEMK